MNINGIDIPERILTAQQENKLVIFAGAGISIASPSNLPDFNDLAKRIEVSTLCNRKKDEPIDTYLGRVYHEGKDIYEIIANILSSMDSTYNSYHTNLLKLFPQDQIRLVTTNQDMHFSTATKDIFQKDIKKYYSPALPLAKSFEGIVYLHGSIEDNFKKMVFTDSDFGEAYLVEGWASRFLKDLFEKYVVLFIGYSYNDPVMKYLSRGIEYNENRFIFTHKDSNNSDDDWRRLHITPIYFKDYSQLMDCIDKWVKLYSLKYIDQKERLRIILSNEATMKSDDKDYLFYIISKDYGVKFFCDLANSYYWFKFLLSEGVLDFIFNNKQLSFNEMCLANWAIDNFLMVNTEDFLITLVQKSNYLNPYVTKEFVNSFYKIKKEEKQGNKILLTQYHNKLFSLILNQSYKIEAKFYLELLLLELEVPKDINTLLLLFKYLIKPEIKLEKSFRIINNDEFCETAELKCNLSGDLDNIKETWGEVIKPNLHLFAYDLILTVSEYLKNIYLLLGISNKIGYDPLSSGRSSIEKHDQDTYGDDFLFLIDIARDTIDYLILSNSMISDSIINLWSNSDALILERLSLYSIKKEIHLNSDEKINWLLKKGWLHKLGAKKEVYDLVQFSYGELTKEIKSKLLFEILNLNITDDKELKDYEIYNFLIFLNNSFPCDEIINNELNKMLKKNPNFKPRQHPEFNTWFGIGDYETKSPISKRELLSKDPVVAVKDIFMYRNYENIEHEWQYLLRELAEAVRDNEQGYNWTEKFIFELEQKNELCSDIFESIIRGLEKEIIPIELLEKLLNLFKTNYNSFNIDIKKQISWFVLGQIGHNKEGIKLITIEKIFDLIRYIYTYHKNNLDKNTDNILNRDISISDNLMICIFKLFNIIMDEDKNLDSDISNNLFSFIEEIAFDKSMFSINAKTEIAIDYAFINYYRPELADKMSVLYDLDGPEKQYAMAFWKGFLSRGQYNDSVVNKIFNSFQKLFLKISSEDSQLIEAFCLKAAGFAIYCETEETRNKQWILQMIDSVNKDVRVNFAKSFNRILNKLDSIKADVLWKTWIQDYWAKRNNNIPVELDQNEINEMMYWVEHFDNYFPEAVDSITRKYLPFNNYILIGFEKKDNELINKHPNSVAKYFYNMLKNVSPSSSRYDMHCIEQFCQKIFKCTIDTSLQDSIKQHMVRLGITMENISFETNN